MSDGSEFQVCGAAMRMPAVRIQFVFLQQIASNDDQFCSNSISVPLSRRQEVGGMALCFDFHKVV